MLLTICVILIIAVLIVIWGIGTQNKLVHSEELCGNALSQIGVQQASRWDALNALADLTKGYSDQEYNVLMDTISARRNVGSKTAAADAEKQEHLLAQSFGHINALAEAYPDLKSNTVYIQTMASVRDYEDKVRMSRMVYNDTVTKFNRMVRSFPASLIADFLGYGIRDYFQDNPDKSDMPDMKR